MSRTRYQRIEAKVRTFLELDAKEIVALQSQFDKAVKRDGMFGSKAGDLLEEINDLDLEDITAFPLFEQVAEAFEEHADGGFPEAKAIQVQAKKDLDREDRGLGLKTAPWADKAFAGEADEVCRALKRMLKAKAHGRSSDVAKRRAERLYRKHEQNEEVRAANKALMSYGFAEEWLDSYLDGKRDSLRANRRLRMIAEDEETALINRGLRVGDPMALNAMSIQELRALAPGLIEMLSKFTDQQETAPPNGLRFTHKSEDAEA